MGTTNHAAPADDAATWIEIDCNPENYKASIKTLRTALAVRTCVKWLKVKPTGTGESVRLCMDAKSLYINAVRGAAKVWYKFTDAEGAVPTGAKDGQDGHYSHLSAKGKKAQQINKTLATLVLYKGVDVDPQVRADLWTIVQLTAEAARFKSVRSAMRGYLQSGFFDLTSTEKIVKNWQSSTQASDPDVIVLWLA